MLRERKFLWAVLLISFVNFITYYRGLDTFFRADGLAAFSNFADPGYDFWYWTKIDLSIVVYQVFYKLWGLNPVPLHLLSLLMHTGVCILMLMLIMLIVKDFTIALLSSLLYSVFYLNSSVVLWEACIAHVISVFLSLAAIVLFLSFERSIKITVLTFSLLLLAMFFKPLAMISPFLLVVLAMSLRRDFGLREAISFICLSFAYFLYMKFGPQADLVQAYAENSSTNILKRLLNFLGYGMVPFWLGHITKDKSMLIIILFFVIYYAFVRCKEWEGSVRLLFLCTVVSYMPQSIGGWGIEARYQYMPSIFLIPIIVIFLRGIFEIEYLKPLQPVRLTAAAVVVLMVSNYISVQRVQKVYGEAGEICRRDLETGSSSSLTFQLYTLPSLFSPTVWLDGHFYEPALKLYRKEKGKGL